MASEHSQVPEGSSSPSRYARMKAILDEAASGSTASYQGHERFWHLPLAAFLELTLYGVRMIAPAVPGAAAGAGAGHSACCHAPATSPAAASQSSPGRGAASGLIKGLKGQFPFDGSQFPPLPWGGKRVAENDVQLIEQWIDTGCPAEDTPPASQVEVRATQRLERCTGEHWLAVGDAGSAVDPLSSQGILRALRFGIYASYGICDWFAGRPPGLPQYAALVQAEFERYLSVRAEVYSNETRWPDTPFWARRNPVPSVPDCRRGPTEPL